MTLSELIHQMQFLLVTRGDGPVIIQTSTPILPDIPHKSEVETLEAYVSEIVQDSSSFRTYIIR